MIVNVTKGHCILGEYVDRLFAREQFYANKMQDNIYVIKLKTLATYTYLISTVSHTQNKLFIVLHMNIDSLKFIRISSIHWINILFFRT